MEITDIGFDPKTGFPFAFANVDIIDVNFEKGESFDMTKLAEYGQGDLSKKIVVDFKGVALQLEGIPTDKHPTMPRKGGARASESKSERPALAIHIPRSIQESKSATPSLTVASLREALLNVEQSFVVPDPRGGQLEIAGVAIRDLGDKSFMEFYGVDYPVYTGAMAKGIGSADLVIANGQRRILSSFGAGGLPKDTVAKAVDKIQAALGQNGPYAINLIHSPFDDHMERFNVELFLSKGVRVVEASAFMKLTPHVVRYRVAGLERGADGKVLCRNKIIFKVSRTELAEMAMRPAPLVLVNKLVAQGLVTQAQADMSQLVPMADDVAVEADSGGHTDNRPIQVIFPIIVAVRNAIQAQYKFVPRVRVGCGGGIGCPQAVHAAFSMGAAFVLTGTVNQMSRQAGTSDRVRKVLSEASYSDVTMAPAADMFDEGVELQVLKKGTMFPNRARKLYELFIRYGGVDEIPEDERVKLEKNVFKMTIAEVWNETKDFYINRLNDPEKVARAELAPKLKMSMAFRWYLGNSSRWANIGEESRAHDYQIWCGPAIGSFNEFIKGSFLDPTVSKVFPCVVQTNLHLLRGACYLLRLQQLRQAKVAPEVVAEIWEPYFPVQEL
jgi:PfaD family protein